MNSSLLDKMNLAGKNGLTLGIANKHSIAYGCAKAVHELGAEPLMHDGGCLLTISYYGAEKIVDNYNLIGPINTALEASTRYMAAELGPRGIRGHAIPPGPLKTRAASGIAHFDELLDEAAERAPGWSLESIEDLGAVAACLISDMATTLTGHTVYVDAGYHISA